MTKKMRMILNMGGEVGTDKRAGSYSAAPHSSLQVWVFNPSLTVVANYCSVVLSHNSHQKEFVEIFLGKQIGKNAHIK